MDLLVHEKFFDGLEMQGRQLTWGHFSSPQGLLFDNSDFRVTPTLSMIRTLVVQIALNFVSTPLSILDKLPSWVLGMFKTATTFLRSGMVLLLFLLLLGLSCCTDNLLGSTI